MKSSPFGISNNIRSFKIVEMQISRVKMVDAVFIFIYV